MTRRIVHHALLAWVAMLGVDLLLHGGLLAAWYVRPSPFLLSPEDAFLRVPLGYVGFLLLAGFLAWLYARLDIWGGGPGYRLGLGLGLVLWAAFVLGLASITTAPWSLLIAWWVGQALELGVGGAVVGSARSRERLGPLWIRVVVLVAVCVLLTFLLQTLGVAPTVRAS